MKQPVILFSVAASSAIFLSSNSDGFFWVDGLSVSLPIHRATTASTRSIIQHPQSASPRSSSNLFMSDFDFPTAMPEKPQQSVEDKMAQSADDFIVSFQSALGEGVEPPPEWIALKELRAKGDTDSSKLAYAIYQLMIERGMLYDEAPETGTLTPTEFDIPSNLKVPEVQSEFGYLYKYGMMLLSKGLLTEDQVKETVLERLIKRTGLSPEEFDAWLGY